MQHPDEGTIHAWLDGELPPEAAANVEAHATTCDACSAAIAEARGLTAAASRILTVLDDVPASVIPAGGANRRPWYARTQVLAAAALILVAGASVVLTRATDQAAGGMSALHETGESASADAQDTSAEAEIAELSARPVAGSVAAAPAASPAASESRDESARESNTAATAEAGFSGRGTRSLRRAVAPRTDAGSADAVAQNALPRGIAVTTGVAASPSAPAPPAATAPTADRVQKQPEPSTLQEVVVTSVAVEAMAPVRRVRVDSTAVEIRTTFEVSPGVRVTLTERAEPADRQATGRALSGGVNRREGSGVSAGSAPPSPPPPASPPPAAAQSAAAAAPRKPPAPMEKATTAEAARTNSVSWFDPIRRKHFVLSGPLSREQLEALRPRLQQANR